MKTTVTPTRSFTGILEGSGASACTHDPSVREAQGGMCLPRRAWLTDRARTGPHLEHELANAQGHWPHQDLLQDLVMGRVLRGAYICHFPLDIVL